MSNEPAIVVDPVLIARLAHADWERHRIGPLRALDGILTIETTDGALAGYLRRAFGSLPASQGVGDGTVLGVLPPDGGSPGAVVRDGFISTSSGDPAALIEHLVWLINQHVIRSSSSRLLLHAGAVARDGVAVVLPAGEEAGKTTLVAGLVHRGSRYLTDEAAAIAPDLSVEGYLKPLSIEQGSWDVLRHLRPEAPDAEAYVEERWQVPPAEIGQVESVAELGVIVFPQYIEDAPTVLTPIGDADALVRAARCTFVTDGPHLSTERLRRLADVVAAVPTFELLSGDLEGACEAVEGLLASGGEL